MKKDSHTIIPAIAITNARAGKYKELYIAFGLLDDNYKLSSIEEVEALLKKSAYLDTYESDDETKLLMHGYSLEDMH